MMLVLSGHWRRNKPRSIVTLVDDWKHSVSNWIQTRAYYMNEAAFQDLVDRLGDDLKAWPVAERSDAQALLLVSAGARAILDDARRLRAAFADLPVPLVPRDFSSRILALIEVGDIANPATPAE
jgi:hypothetical protein